jgi:hypothetical protein
MYAISAMLASHNCGPYARPRRLGFTHFPRHSANPRPLYVEERLYRHSLRQNPLIARVQTMALPSFHSRQRLYYKDAMKTVQTSIFALGMAFTRSRISLQSYFICTRMRHGGRYAANIVVY